MTEKVSLSWTAVSGAPFGRPEPDQDRLRQMELAGIDTETWVRRQTSEFDAMHSVVDEAEAIIEDADDQLDYLKGVRSQVRKALWGIDRSIVHLSDHREHVMPLLQWLISSSFLILGLLGLVIGNAVGVSYVLGSGHSMYAVNPIGAALFCFAAVIMGALLKSFEKLLPNDRIRRVYGYVIAGTGIVAFMLWLLSAAEVFAPNVGSSLSQLLGNSQGGNSRAATITLMISHIMLDVCGGYVIFSRAEKLLLGGYRTIARSNPEYEQMKGVLDKFDDLVRVYLRSRAEGRAMLRQFDANREVVMLDAEIEHKRVAAMHRHEREAAIATANVSFFSDARKKTVRSAAVALFAVSQLFMANDAIARAFVVVVPTNFAGPAGQLLEPLGALALQLKPDDHLYIYRVEPPGQIAHIAVPQDERARNSAWARRQITEQFGPVIQTIETMAGSTASGPEAENVRLPEVIDEIATNLLPSLPEKRAEILVIGSPFYHDPRDKKFSMLDGYYPTDAHLLAPRTETPYGLAGSRKRLLNSNVHLCWPNSKDRFVSTAHEEVVRRWWTLWVAHQAGLVGTTSYHLGTCFRRFYSGDSSGQPSYNISPSGKIEMLRVNPPISTGLPTSQDQPGAWFLRDDAVISKIPPTTTTGIAWIGLRWRAAADIDLWARPDSSSPWLFFGNVRTEAGFFNKDHLTATGDSQFEFIEMIQKIDLSKAEVMINLYEGELRAPPEGVIRVWFSGSVYQAPFKLAATRGNRGMPPMSGPHWVRVDLRKVVGLTP